MTHLPKMPQSLSVRDCCSFKTKAARSSGDKHLVNTHGSREVLSSVATSHWRRDTAKYEISC
ncbi:hypothetical protein SCLCIDRAFT_293571 [Scleroderma citrinum Foug A]|uniref:Uncharacterized protein n=1 Tax=Scleroderma citrinum Foug A TaxID=1036808 RepID=A0A0C3EFJ1_9AGAM|nr:hypothetical protein SCLCIDRAFT_293571 [Scleroderma citrinum Foug A]